MKKYDAVVIGAGNGGLTAAVRLAQSAADDSSSKRLCTN